MFIHYSAPEIGNERLCKWGQTIVISYRSSLLGGHVRAEIA